jgi:hypothetical protein
LMVAGCMNGFTMANINGNTLGAVPERECKQSFPHKLLIRSPA